MKQKNYFKMKYSLGTNFDLKLLDIIAEKDKDHSIESVFGKMRSDFIGGGRGSLFLPDVSWKKLKYYISETHKKNLGFNYLINPLCMDNKEFIKKYNKKIVNYLKQLEDIGVNAITVNSPYLCELIKLRFPYFSVTVGLGAQVGTLQQIRYWENLGADEITLLENINRNFQLLEILLKYTKKSNTKLRLIANNICLHNCPYVIHHGTTISHASQKGHYSNSFTIDYCLLKCSSDRYLNPAKLLSSNWIRPEDIVYYEDLCNKLGADNFSIKLLDRSSTTELLDRVITAYLSRSFDGNLIDILNVANKKSTKKIHMFPFILKALTGFYNINMLLKYGEIFEFPKYYIDNKRLNGFLKKFIYKYQCNKNFCDDNGLDLDIKKDNENFCHYCKTWAKKVIKFDKDEINEWGKKSKKFLTGYLESKMNKFIG